MRILLPSLLICFTLTVSAQENTKVSDAFSNGDAAAIAAYFNNSVEVNLPQHNGIFQKDQASMLLKNFFSTHPPKSFEIKHEGGSERKSSFQIGRLTSEKAVFRTYLIYNSVEGKIQIIELRIEEE